MAFAVLSAGAWAQGPITLTVDRSDLGIEGIARAGSWAPARLTLSTSELTARGVVCRWMIRDVDGDTVAAERSLVVNPGVDQTVWLYAPLPIDWRPDTPWDFEVLDVDSGQRLASVSARPIDVVAPGVAAIGLFTSAQLGLDPYHRRDSQGRRLDLQHEALLPVRSLLAERLPDRWQGLDLFNTLIWTSEGESLDGPNVPLDTQRALTEWVRRGGHLIISLPSVGSDWLDLADRSPLKPLVPIDRGQTMRIQGDPPTVLGITLARPRPVITRTIFRLPAQGVPGIATVVEDDDGQPIGIAHRVGFGRVTLLGIDLADPNRTLTLSGLPTGRYRIWRDLLGWQSPAIERQVLQQRVDDNEYGKPHLRQDAYVDDWVAGQTDRPGTVATAMLLAILVFGVYWLVAGPITYAVLRARKQPHLAWAVFSAVVVVFTAIAWGGAMLLRPAAANVTHFTIADFDAASGQARVQSWFSLYLPNFGPQDVAIPSEQPDSGDLLYSAGLDRDAIAARYPDPQTYTLDAANPHALPPDLPNARGVPFRSTSKSFAAHYIGPVTDTVPGITEPWVPPQGDLRLVNAWPTGELAHELPGTLTDALAVYCPGDNQTPLVWNLGDWPPGTILRIQQPSSASELIRTHSIVNNERQWEREGFLGVTFKNFQRAGLPNLSVGTQPANSRLTVETYVASFFAYLPPPDYTNTSLMQSGTVEARRALLRDADLSPLLAGRRFIIIGNLRNAPSPLPLTVRDEAIPSRGWTLVRWVYELE